MKTRQVISMEMRKTMEMMPSMKWEKTSLRKVTTMEIMMTSKQATMTSKQCRIKIMIKLSIDGLASHTIKNEHNSENLSGQLTRRSLSNQKRSTRSLNF